MQCSLEEVLKDFDRKTIEDIRTLLDQSNKIKSKIEQLRESLKNQSKYQEEKFLHIFSGN